MQEWEYHQMVAYEWEIHNLEGSLKGSLNLLGSDGWELCTMVQREANHRSGGDPYWLLIFKRPKGGI
jgi:hypothetical protein